MKTGYYKPYTQRRGSMQHGRSTVWITCPWCGYEVEAYSWSLAGSGKLCPKCGAKHTLYYGTYKETEDETKGQDLSDL